jgi:chromate transporter
MFSFAAFLGAELAPQNQLFGALIATVAIFLPGFLLLLCIQGSWEALARKPKVAGATWGINAAVVGLLFSALYQPLFVSAVISPIDMAWVLIGYFSLRVIKIPIVVLVLGFMFVGGGSVLV